MEKRGHKIRNRVEREAVLARVEQMRIRGRKDWEIAKEVGVTKRQVYYYLREIELRWQEKNLEDLSAYKKIELAKINELERTYWEAWYRSLDGGKKGNPAFLAGIDRCIERRCKLLGLYAPAQINLRDVTELSDEQLMQIAGMGIGNHSPGDLLEQAKEAATGDSKVQSLNRRRREGK